jgi:hypothetical protein
MAYERSWQFLPMQGPRVAASIADHSSYSLWMLKSFLKGEIGGATQGLWTCVGSSDGTTAALDGVDRWGTVFNIANVPYTDAAGGAHAWIVLSRSYTVNAVSYTVYLLLSAHGYGLLNNGMCATVMSIAAPSGGTPTVDPTFTQAIHTHSTQNINAHRYAGDFVNSRRWYGGLTTLGDFWFIETITGEISRAFYFAAPVGTKANDQAPFYVNIADNYIGGTTTLIFPFHGGSLFSRGLITAQGGAMPGLFYNGSAGQPVLVAPPDWGTSSFTDASDISLFDFPAWVVVANNTNATPGSVHARGRLPDTGLCSGSLGSTSAAMRPVNVGTTIRDAANNVIYVTLGALIVPYNALLS